MTTHIPRPTPIPRATSASLAAAGASGGWYPTYVWDILRAIEGCEPIAHEPDYIVIAAVEQLLAGGALTPEQVEAWMEAVR